MLHRDQIVLDLSLPGTRLDAYLRDVFPAVSRGTFQRLINEGHIRVDGRIVKPTHSPRAGEVVEVTWPEPRPAQAEPQSLHLDVLFEDIHLLVINKPAGLVVHPSAGHPDRTLVNGLLHHCLGELSGIGGVNRPGIVHRLDKETSGCLVVAKDDVTHRGLARQFAERSIQKTYLALVCGELTPRQGEISVGIARHPSHRKRMAVVEGGRPSHTDYRVARGLSGASLVEVHPRTGRTHQIRVHFQHLGFPLVGDAIYGCRPNQHLAEKSGYQAPRHMLHAWKLCFEHPHTQKTMDLEAPIPEDFQAALRLLEVR